MKILLLNDYASPLGGAEIMTRSLRDGLRQRGHDARVLASRAGSSRGASFADYECLGTTSRFRSDQACNPWAFVRLRKVLADFQPDVVHVRMFLTQLSPLILPLLRRVPSLYHAAWYRAVCPLGSKLLPDGSPCQESAGRACYRNRCLPLHHWVPNMFQRKLWMRWRDVFDLVVANSHACRSLLIADGMKSVEVVWNGVPVTAPRPALSWPPTVAFAGRFVQVKGVDVLLRAFARVVTQVPQARLLLAGEGPEGDRLKRLAEDLDLSSSVSFLGHLSCPELARQFAAAWVQAVPSRSEAFGLVAAEAMMRGTAVVASRTGGLPELIADGQSGLLVAPGDEVELAAAIRCLVQDQSSAEAMGQEARTRALQQFTEGQCVTQFIALYEAIRSGRPPVSHN